MSDVQTNILPPGLSIRNIISYLLLEKSFEATKRNEPHLEFRSRITFNPHVPQTMWENPLIAMRAYVWICIVLAMCVMWGCSCTLVAGGAGSALYFNHELPDVVGWQWKRPPTTKLTIEFWTYVIDHWMPLYELFAYSVRSFFLSLTNVSF